MIATPGWYAPMNEAWLRAEREKQAKLRQKRENRIKALKREIQVAKQRKREYDHLLAELRGLERDRVEDLKEQAKR